LHYRPEATTSVFLPAVAAPNSEFYWYTLPPNHIQQQICPRTGSALFLPSPERANRAEEKTCTTTPNGPRPSQSTATGAGALLRRYKREFPPPKTLSPISSTSNRHRPRYLVPAHAGAPRSDAAPSSDSPDPELSSCDQTTPLTPAAPAF
jgi:hypothetical protein